MSAKNNAIEAAKKALPKNVIVATIEQPAEMANNSPIGNLKPTPTMPMDFEMKRNAIKTIDRLNVSLERFEITRKNLTSFKLESETNINQQPHLIIKDSGYSGIEFKTHNVEVIKKAIACITEDIDDKIGRVKADISAFELPKI
jgi:hypothetical protein